MAMNDHNNDITIVEFVSLINHDDYEILNVYPFTIRRKNNHLEIKEGIDALGYIYVNLNCKMYKKHRLIAEQFIPNPDNLPQVDHINHDRSDYHIENLRWISISGNAYNRSSHRGVQYRFVDTIPDDSMIVDYYETRNGRHEFDRYYYHDGKFYYDNDINYRVLNINTAKCGVKYVNLQDKNNQFVALYINKFLEQHDLI